MLCMPKERKFLLQLLTPANQYEQFIVHLKSQL